MKIDVMMRDIRVIPLDKIKLDQENVRFGNDVAQNQREAIKLMLSAPEDAKKLLRLAEHIAEHGLDPTELQLVTPDDDGTYIVLEGNRRLTALKLLQRPDLCPSDRGYKGFLKAHNSLENGVPESLQCSVVATRVDGDMWIELKHTGENRGVGRVGWDSDIRDERRARTTGIESIGRQVRNLITENQHIFSSKAELDVFEVDVTTLTRIFSSSLGQSTFRLKVENKLLVPQLALEHIAPSVEFLLDMFVSHGYNVNDVRKHENQIITLGHIPADILPHKLAEAAKIKPTLPTPEMDKPEVKPATETTNAETSGATQNESNGGNNQAPPPNTGSPVERNGSENANGINDTDISASPDQPGAPQAPQAPSTDTSQGDKGQPSPEPQKEPGIRARPQVRARKYLTPFSLKITNSRINAIYNELRTVLRVDECPNATAITFRVFLETTCDEYIKLKKEAGTPIIRWDNQKEIRGGGDGDKLSTKVQAVIKQLQSEDLVANGPAKAIFKRAGSPDQLGSIDHFNLFVHGAHGAPVPSELKDIAEEYRPMLEAIWR
ncbi:MAG: hypothetical protein ACN6P1_16645 [Pseudomonas sp.]|uniref:hypothetical protein n=1 Tax=Pseudomonas sp. TaxID=306 RepID=UPI003D1431AB